MKINIGQRNDDEENKDIDYIYQNYRPANKTRSYNSFRYSSRKENKWIIQLLVSGVILILVAGLFKVNIPFTGPLKSSIEYLMSSETNVQPVFYKVVQLASQAGNLEWPSIDDTFEPAQTAATDTTVPSDEVITLPVSGNVTRLYGWTLEPGQRIQVFHSGLDIAVPVGTAVKASTGGRVIEEGETFELGRYLLVKTGANVMMRYANLSTAEVHTGVTVKPGQVLGKVGQIEGKQAHLHFEVVVNGKPIDPLDKLGIDVSGAGNSATDEK